METFIVVARTLHFAACVSLAGEFAFECLVGGATLRVCGGDLRRRLSGLAWTSLGLALISGIAWLVGLAVTMSGQPLGQALHAGTLATVLTQTRVGEDWQLRFGFAVLLGASFVWSRRRGDASRGVAWLGLTLAVLLLVTLAWAGHGASDEGIDGDIHLAADLLHLLTAGLWLGGLVPFVLLLAAARQSRDADAVVAMRSATHRFSVVAVVSVGVLLLSGVVNTWYLSGSMPALLGTTYGQLLLLKIGLFLVMLTVAAVNRLRLTPRLGGTEPARAATQLQRNALLETAIGLGILAIVGAIGTMAPGLHTEPVWPLPFRLDTNALSTGAAILLLIFATALCVCIVTVVVAFATGRKRLLGAAIVGLIVCIAFGGAPAAPALVVAYPTTFFAPPVPYDATAVVHGAVVYAQNCAVCHGADGRGDGPAAASLPIKPADLVEAHLFAHNVGDLYWWIGHGLGGVMPPFRGTLSPTDRWTVIHFVRARAAGVLTADVGPEVNAVAASQMPDFAFESSGVQDTLNRVLAKGPALLVLFGSDPPTARLQILAKTQPKLIAAGVSIVAVGLGTRSAANAPYAVGVSAGVATALKLFRTADDSGETELMLDRNGNIRARWTVGDLAAPDTLAADARRVAQFSAAAPSHAGHGG